jgi:methenyltetrahydromethanopterin cyclohydrolase
MSLNESACVVVVAILARAEGLRVAEHILGGARVIDLGIAVRGGLQAGLELARVCLADRAEVSIVPSNVPGLPGPAVQVHSDDPVRACLASQYAGWSVSAGKYFAMGSGPMRAAYGKEAIYAHIPGRESAPDAVGVLETRKLPTEEVIAYLAECLGLSADHLTLLCAPASSIAGSVQVVARALETAMHKLHALGFDPNKVLSGYGIAPMPPIGRDDITAIGWTNDAILYGGQVTVWVDADDDEIAAIGPRVPSSSSKDHGEPFRDIFERAGKDFYKIDPHLFSPATIEFCNLKTGRRHAFGQLEPEVLRRSFGG